MNSKYTPYCAYHLGKDYIKTLAHQLPFVPYRKPSKRYKTWNHYRERRFLRSLDKLYKNHSAEIDPIYVSVVMPAYNRAHCISKAIDSVLQQNHQNFEVIIVDDGSKDLLKLALAPYLADERIKLIQKEHGGVSSARNAGIDAARGQYIFYLDTDNRWNHEFMRFMLTFMKAGKLDAAYAGAKIINDKKSVIGYFGEVFYWRECWELNHIDINCFAHRKELLHKGFKFDETLKRLVDWDFILAITAYHRTAYAPFIGVEYYDGSRGNRITNTEQLENGINNVIRHIQQKHFNALNDERTSDPEIRPRWRNIIKKW